MDFQHLTKHWLVLGRLLFMANILLVDPDEVAHRAMRGILARAKHRFVAVGTALEAWELIQRSVKVDLVLTELKLKGDNGLSLIQRLKSDYCLNLLPVVVYTGFGDKDSVKKTLALKVQNFLVKPYHDDAIYTEIAKAAENPWRLQHFEEEKSFCQMMGFMIENLHQMLESLRTSLELIKPELKKWAEMQAGQPILDALEALSAKAEEVGAWGVVACLKVLHEKALAASWPDFQQNLELLDFAGRLIFRHLNSTLTPEDFLTSEEINSENEARARMWWSTAPEQNRCPVVNWPQLQREIEALAGCPVIDSVAAAFQMAANGHPTSLNPIMDLVEKDPGLTAQMLIASNKLRAKKEDDDYTAIEDPRIAVGLLGEVKLSSIGRSLVTVEERLMHAPPSASWPQFWMFQLGTARLARYTCIYLEIANLESAAYTAGLLHDLGKLLLIQLHPFALQAIQDYAFSNRLKLAAAEKLFLGTTTHEMAAHFAEKQGLPKRFSDVMRWMDNPEAATENSELVAIVSLARDLCRQNHVGFCGDTPKDEAVPLADTAEWQILRSQVFLNFDLKKFEAQVQNECRQLKRELQGKLDHYAVA